MARYCVPQLRNEVYHLTARTPNREDFHLPLDEVWEVLQSQLYAAHHFFGMRIKAMVLMPNHFHLLASFSEALPGAVMCRFLSETSKEMNRRAGRINQCWGGRHYKTRIRSLHHAINVYKYIYQNPVRAGLVRRAEEWRFSTLHGIIGLSHLLIPVQEDELLASDLDSTLRWINQEIKQDHLRALRLSLSRAEFRFPLQGRSAHPLDFHFI